MPPAGPPWRCRTSRFFPASSNSSPSSADFPMRPIRPFLPLLLAPAFALAQTAAPDPVSIRAPVIALTHVRVIDGLGHAPVDDQTLVITGGRIAAVGAAAQVEIPAGAA